MSCCSLVAQNDTIRVKNGGIFYGRIKGLTASVLTVKTPNSKKDFQIKFARVAELVVQRRCYVILSGGRRETGYIKSLKPNEFTLTYANGTSETFPLTELITLEIIGSKFFTRFRAYLDISYNLTRANNASQISVGGGLVYRAPEWKSTFDFSALDSRQNNAEDIRRISAQLGLLRVTDRRNFLFGGLAFLTNTEQSLQARYLLTLGVGRYLVLSNKLGWGVNVGINYNIENFSDNSTLPQQSVELGIGTELDMFDFKDWTLKSTLIIYPSLSESGRWRADYSLYMKWNLPLEFYLKPDLQFNYDNQAATRGSEFDYIFTLGIGWKFD